MAGHLVSMLSRARSASRYRQMETHNEDVVPILLHHRSLEPIFRKISGIVAIGAHSLGSSFIEYAVEEYPVRLISADTLSTRSNKGEFCSERAERLIGLINAEKTKPIAVLAHHPPFEVMVGPDSTNFETLEMMERLRGTLQKSGRVIAVFNGHVHRATGGSVGHIPAVVVPCIATTLRKGDYPVHMKKCPIYYLHRFGPLWEFVTEARIVGAER